MSTLFTNLKILLSQQSLHKKCGDELTMREERNIIELKNRKQKNLLMCRVLQKQKLLLSRQSLKINFSDELASQRPTNITESAITGENKFG